MRRRGSSVEEGEADAAETARVMGREMFPGFSHMAVTGAPSMSCFGAEMGEEARLLRAEGVWDTRKWGQRTGSSEEELDCEGSRQREPHRPSLLLSFLSLHSPCACLVYLPALYLPCEFVFLLPPQLWGSFLGLFAPPPPFLFFQVT